MTKDFRLHLLAALALTVSPVALAAQETPAPDARGGASAGSAPIEARAQIRNVTLFPWGAQVVREVQVNASGDGPVQILVPDLPDGTSIEALRLSGEGLRIGAATLIDERPPVTGRAEDPRIAAARDEVARREEALATRRDEIATIRLQAEAAMDRVRFLSGLSTEGMDAAQALDLARRVSDQTLSARSEALAAEAEARRAETTLKPDVEALEDARKALAALENPSQQGDILQATVEGSGTLTITSFVENAGWTPSYDLHLDRASGTVRLDRFVSVHQASGEDWTGVDLTLSTARPSERTDPGEVWPWLRRFGPPEEMTPKVQMRAEGAALAAPMAEAMVADRMDPQMQGIVLTYTTPDPVTMRDGVEALRLSLDTVEMEADVHAEAVPLFDDRAYLVAEVENGDELLLPGPVSRFVDGALVGGGKLELLPAGEEADWGFGAIDGLTLRRVIETRMEGDRGVIARSNDAVEEVRLEVENLTGEAWPVRLVDRVPYSEQEDLQIDWTSDLEPAEVAPDDRPGVLAWRFDLAPGDTQVVRLKTEITWPEGQVLR